MTKLRPLLLWLALLAPAVHAQLLAGTPGQKALDAQAFEPIAPLLADRATDIQSLVVV
ncbi:MAG: hypothetical protein K0R58_2932, partial [Ramlibacter sp.]|nr:hypothetical protein [Ramlibacter sp.]